MKLWLLSVRAGWVSAASFWPVGGFACQNIFPSGSELLLPSTSICTHRCLLLICIAPFADLLRPHSLFLSHHALSPLITSVHPSIHPHLVPTRFLLPLARSLSFLPPLSPLIPLTISTPRGKEQGVSGITPTLRSKLKMKTSVRANTKLESTQHTHIHKPRSRNTHHHSNSS